ncbi:MAG: NADH:flavin oxidoreductase/NADH oxidase [Paracoccus sp. (in: a-proteobacteria)]|uniref:NADH:flavin oxidoreductase/NADH oxidase n=1 Tax=Paracoccus sp. TaxID=267 RepID=UPI0026DEE88C|nr:NADH:flavin oxidoreductase/NADH oxidase [Paracoccus sp. (in: a-proteobacteria)]MDO5630899.1 NADH:flavin oxidoreductase/NADH oxidase [Paracoccus sp. (in: a-proteobacteria)]
MSSLFQPLTVKDVTARNRIAVPPMCQYMADDGLANDWHRVHYGALGQGGAGVVVVEATAVSPEGRITPNCLGLWNDEQAEKLADIARLIAAHGAVPGIQIAHAGRKASANRPWDGDDHIPNDAPKGWQTIAPSAVAFGGHLGKVPTEMTQDDIARVRADFVAAAIRARDAGFRWLELHFAHGYLAQSFYNDKSNQRGDEYGGSPENRARFLIETLRDVRKVWPENLPLTARLGVLEFDGRDEAQMAETIALTTRFRDEGLDLLSVSVGFTTADGQIPWATPGFLAPYAKRIRQETGLLVSSAWGFDEPGFAQQCVSDGTLDQVLIGKAHLADPHWTYLAATRLGVENPADVLPDPYAHWLRRYRFAG